MPRDPESERVCVSKLSCADCVTMFSNPKSEIRNPKLPQFLPNPTPCGRSRREFLWQVGGGFASLALVDLLGQDGFFGSAACAEDRPGQAGRQTYGKSAKHCIFL